MSDKWTLEDIPNLSGKVIIVTGANSGIGFEAAKQFAIKGAEIVLACRKIEKATKAYDKIKRRVPDVKLRIIQLDLASLRSVQQFSEEFRKIYSRLDVLVHNAGIMAAPYQKTEDGFESHFGVNHLGHFALTGHLFDLLTSTPMARVVNVSSNGHIYVKKMDFERLLYKDRKNYKEMDAYGYSKLANVMFTYELDRRFKKANINAIAVAAHPGSLHTNLARQWYYTILKLFVRIFLFPLMQSAKMGALPIIRASIDPNVKGAEYYGPRSLKGIRGYPVQVESSEASYNEEDAQKLWQLSEELTNVSFLI